MYKRHSSVCSISIKRITVKNLQLHMQQVSRARSLIWCYLQQFLAGLCKEPESHGSQFPAHLPSILLTHAFCVLQIKETHSQYAACGHSFSSHTHSFLNTALLPMDGFSGYLQLANNEEKTLHTRDPPGRGRERKGWRLSMQGVKP